MKRFLNLLDAIPFWGVLILCATLGLAAFRPQPHIWEKLGMLAAGDLTRAVDVFDLILHGVPWALLIAKGLRLLRSAQ